MGFFTRRAPAARGQNLPPVAQTVVEQRAECAICFEPLAGNAATPVCRLVTGSRSCGHYVHRACAERWRAQNSVCPVCRAPFSELRTFPSIDDARAWFQAVDADGNGRLDQREVAAALKACLADLDSERFDRELPTLWRRWDKNGDGTLTFDELFQRDGLVNYVRGAYRGHREDGEPPPLSDPRGWFSFWDYDGSNSLDKAEIHRALVKTFGLAGQYDRISTMADTLNAVWGIFDHDGSGDVDRAEFAASGGLGETLNASLADFSALAATHWQPPRVQPTPVLEATVVSAAPPPPAYHDAPPQYLPPGWEERQAPDGRAYFIDHNTQRTQWHRPS
mmetsp:Transcript_19398/g.57673  ORF Transcript_19398/g.57673 Transcript_19398/m.57673 type:complete len:335 (-) Transcript_19398:37-1041(-)